MMVITLAPPRLPVNSPVSRLIALPAPFSCEAQVYIDTISFAVKQTRLRKNPRLLTAIRQANGGRLQSMGWPVDSPNAIWRICKLHQPTPEALAALAHNRIKLGRVDVAFDMDERQGRWIVHHLLQKWHGKRQANQTEHVTYWAKDARTRRNITYYDDRPSKVTGEPCAHLELRFKSLRATQAAGLSDPGTLQDFDAAALLARQVRLAVLDERALRYQLRKTARNLMNRRPAARARYAPALRNYLARVAPRYTEMRVEQVVDHLIERQLRRMERADQTEAGKPTYRQLNQVPAQALYHAGNPYRKALRNP